MEAFIALAIWAALIVATIVYALSDAAKPATVCAWCNKIISGSIINGPVSHGICRPCRLRVEREEMGRTAEKKEARTAIRTSETK